MAEVIQYAVQQRIRQPIKMLYPERVTQRPGKNGIKLTDMGEGEGEYADEGAIAVLGEIAVLDAGDVEGTLAVPGEVAGVAEGPVEGSEESDVEFDGAAGAERDSGDAGEGLVEDAVGSEDVRAVGNMYAEMLVD